MAAGTARAKDSLNASGTSASGIASVRYGGPDLRTVYRGSLMGTCIPYFRAPSRKPGDASSESRAMSTLGRRPCRTP